jgi:hypothetical protein
MILNFCLLPKEAFLFYKGFYFFVSIDFLFFYRVKDFTKVCYSFRLSNFFDGFFRPSPTPPETRLPTHPKPAHPKTRYPLT